MLIYMFSTLKESDKPVGFIKGGKFDGHTIFVHQKNSADKGTILYEEIDLKGKGNEGAIIKPIVNVKGDRDIIYIAGCSGSGKSHLASLYIQSYHKLFRHNKIYVVSCANYKDDPAFNSLKMKQIDIATLPINIHDEKYKNSLFLFDDIESYGNTEQQKNVYKLVEQIAQNGRKLGIYLIVTSHLINPNNKSYGRVIMNELHNLCIFPHGASKHQIKYALKQYMGLDAAKINRICNTDSRYVIVSKTYPNYVLEEKQAYMAND